MPLVGAPCPNAFRTVVVIENFSLIWKSAPEAIELDVKGRASNFEPIPPVHWTWLTWAAEACFEYCRIAWDVYPDYKVSIFGCEDGPDPVEICPFDRDIYSTPVKLRDFRLRMARLMQLNQAPIRSSDGALKKIFEKVKTLETESMLSVPMFYENLDKVSPDQPFYIRFVIVTADTDRERIRSRIRKCITDSQIGYLARFEVAVVVLGGHPQSSNGTPSYEKIDPHEELYVTWYNTPTGLDVVSSFKSCLTWDLRLSRTIVTDIPMREDVKTGGSTSVSYNVDLFHPCLIGEGGVQGKPGGDALRMKWVRPVKGVVPALVPADNTQLIRASPSDPITRPTQCLVGYVLDGNAVLLESDAPSTVCKLFLCDGKISLQQLKAGTERCIDDIVALSDLPGGRVSSYRVKEMVALLSATSLDSKAFPLRKAALEKHSKLTSYFPIVYNDTIVYLLPQFIPLLEAVSTSSPKEANWDAAKRAIDDVLEMEKHGQTLPGISSHALLQSFPSAIRKTESYALTWAELDLLLEACSYRSMEHVQLRDYLIRAKRTIREDLKTLIKSRLRARLYNGPANSATRSLEKPVSSRKRKPRPEFEGRLKFGRIGKLYLNLQKSDKNQRDDVLIHASLEL